MSKCQRVGWGVHAVEPSPQLQYRGAVSSSIPGDATEAWANQPWRTGKHPNRHGQMKRPYELNLFDEKAETIFLPCWGRKMKNISALPSVSPFYHLGILPFKSYKVGSPKLRQTKTSPASCISCLARSEFEILPSTFVQRCRVQRWGRA